MEPRKITEDIYALPSYAEIPGFGMLPVNAFVLKAREPVLVDTGLHQDKEAFQKALAQVIDPGEIKWLWLTHPDQDHLGCYSWMLETFPDVRVVTNFLGMGILSTFNPLDPQRAYFLNPGESLDVGDRKLTAVRPPSFDSPATSGFYDSKSGALFSSDCFGALLQNEAEDVNDIREQELREGQTLWATIDAPWLHTIDQAKLGAQLKEIQRMNPSYILSAHLPTARGKTEQLLETLAETPNAQPFLGPNQAALESMILQLTQGVPQPV